MSHIDQAQYANVKATLFFTSYMFPFCTKIQKFEFIVKLFMLLFVIDDHKVFEYGEMGFDTDNLSRFSQDLHDQKSRYCQFLFGQSTDKTKEVWEGVIEGFEKILKKRRVCSEGKGQTLCRSSGICNRQNML